MPFGGVRARHNALVGSSQCLISVAGIPSDRWIPTALAPAVAPRPQPRRGSSLGVCSDLQNQDRKRSMVRPGSGVIIYLPGG
jgi:hypothetical protein